MRRLQVICVFVIPTLLVSYLFVSHKMMIQSPLKAKPFEIEEILEDVGPDLFPDAPVSWLHNIFFVDTSCVLMNISTFSSLTKTPSEPGGGLQMTPRVACSLEAAARAHPQRPVYYVHTCPVHMDDMRRSAPEYVQRVLSLANVHLWVEHFANLVRDSALERLISDGKFAKSKFPLTHASDMLRVLLLRQFGGTYLDTDVLMLRSLGDMRNFVSQETGNSLNHAIMDIALDEMGREVTDECLKELQNFDPTKWAENGPRIITRVLKRRCGTDKFDTVTTEKCKGFHIVPSHVFHPVPWNQWEKYYKEKGASDVMKAMNGSLGAHVWNSMSVRNKKNIRVSLRSMQPYAQIARRVCPDVVSAPADDWP